MNNLAHWYENNKDYDQMIKYYLMGAANGHIQCNNRINEHFRQHINIKNMCKAYSYLTSENKHRLNEIIVDVMNINHLDVIGETVCVYCKQVTMCIFDLFSQCMQKVLWINT